MSTYTPSKAALNIELVNVYGKNGLRISVESGSLILEAPTVDALIEDLGRLRSEMRPCVDSEVDRKKQFLVEMDPTWHVQSNALLDGSVLMLRHPGLGWTCFAIPRASLERLVETLQAQLKQPMSVQGLAN